MSGSTTELNLRTAVDADDNADYLTLDLANSLRTIDALFNNVTGHTHQSAHQGGPLLIGAGQIADGSITSVKIADGAIGTVDLGDGVVTGPKLAAGAVTSDKITPPIDIPGYFRSTNVSAYPASGAGLELYYVPGTGGILQSYDRGAQAYQPSVLIGSTVALRIGGTPGLTVNADASTTMRGPLSFVGGVGTINFATNMAITQDGNNFFYRSTNPGNHFFQHIDGSLAGIQVGTVTASGTVSAPSVTFNQSGYYWTGVAGVGVLETNGGIQLDTGLVYFHSNRTVYLQLSGTTLVVAGFTGLTTPSITSQGTTPNTFAGDVTITPPRVLNMGAALLSPGTNLSRSPETMIIQTHAYVYFDLGVGHTVTCQSLVQTSDPRLKSNATVIADADCMTRIRGNVPVYSYQLPPPTSGGDSSSEPTPTPTDIGFMADDVHANSPEFAALDDTGTAVGVNYPNMVALLWGALRSLDARCQAKGV